MFQNVSFIIEHTNCEYKLILYTYLLISGLFESSEYLFILIIAMRTDSNCLAFLIIWAQYIDASEVLYQQGLVPQLLKFVREHPTINVIHCRFNGGTL